MRQLLEKEMHLLLQLAEKVEEHQRVQLLADIQVAAVEAELSSNERLMFSLSGYERPPYRGQHTYPIEARMFDSDGIEISVVLYADENGRLLELEFIRWACSSVIDPKSETLEVW